MAKQIGAGNALVGGAIGDTPIIVRPNGIPVRAVAVLGGGGVTMIATNADENIQSIKQLKGKTLTVMSYSDTTYYALLASLRKAGLSKDDVDIQAAGPRACGSCSRPTRPRPWPGCQTGWSTPRTPA
ncbi:hypothetical protein PspTeo4_25416 [Pseudomonas sp. Teo4]|nr:hypothetical protein [Pseudomonas sp. Teo4]